MAIRTLGTHKRRRHRVHFIHRVSKRRSTLRPSLRSFLQTSWTTRVYVRVAEALAEAAGLDRTYISALEREVYSASLDTIEKLAPVLGVAAFELLQG